MFESNAKLHSIFKKINEGSIESIQEITRADLRDLCIAAASNNFWLSKHAMNIIQNGLDGDIPYTEVLTNSDWRILFNGIYSHEFALKNTDYVDFGVVEYDFILVDSTEAVAGSLD